MVACQWNKSSPIGPAEQDDGGSRPKSVSSLLILFNAIAKDVCVVFEGFGVLCRVCGILEGAANRMKLCSLECGDEGVDGVVGMGVGSMMGMATGPG